jgi:hypothetical protein
MPLLHFVTVDFSGLGFLDPSPNQAYRTRDYTSSGLYSLNFLAWVALPEALYIASCCVYNIYPMF